jgi:hypothetical protein
MSLVCRALPFPLSHRLHLRLHNHSQCRSERPTHQKRRARWLLPSWQRRRLGWHASLPLRARTHRIRFREHGCFGLALQCLNLNLRFSEALRAHVPDKLNYCFLEVRGGENKSRAPCYMRVVFKFLTWRCILARINRPQGCCGSFVVSTGQHISRSLCW